MKARLRLVPAPGVVVPLMPHDPARRGYVVGYRRGERNPCPGCGRENWLVGRAMAECAFCATALPLVEERRSPA